MRGASLREVMDRHAPRLPDPRDRALLMALLSEGARWWLRFDAAVDGLLEKSLRHKDPAVHALLVLGLVQLEILELQDYAAVAATVEAVRALQAPATGRTGECRAASLAARARQPDRASSTPSRRPATRTRRGWPSALQRDWPEQAEAVMVANNREPPLMLRVNRQRARSRRPDRPALQAAGHAAALHPWLADALVLPHSTDVTRMPGFEDGLFAVQDGAAQVAADLADLRDGLRVLDACAAPGGKACHLLERANIDLTALEMDASRAERIRQNLMRLRLNAKIVIGDAGAPQAGGRDSCLRSHPDRRAVLGHRRAAPPARRATASARKRHRGHARCNSDASWRLWPLLAPGGRLVYITCSVLRAENEAIVWRTAGGAARMPSGRLRAARRPGRPPLAGRSCPAMATSTACTTPCWTSRR